MSFKCLAFCNFYSSSFICYQFCKGSFNVFMELLYYDRKTTRYHKKVIKIKESFMYNVNLLLEAKSHTICTLYSRIKTFYTDISRVIKFNTSFIDLGAKIV